MTYQEFFDKLHQEVDSPDSFVEVVVQSIIDFNGMDVNWLTSEVVDCKQFLTIIGETASDYVWSHRSDMNRRRLEADEENIVFTAKKILG